MKDFIQLSITIFAIYLGIKFLKHKFKRKPKINVDALIEAEKMKMMNTIYAQDFSKVERDFRKRGFDKDGIYIFTNLRNNKRYVGQSIRVLKRVKSHLNGSGNPDLYRDLQRGDKFTIQFIRLIDSNFADLNALEKHYITKYNSYHGGYNKTRGNN